MINIGVICEGPSDFPAITNFIGEGLAAAGIHTSFTPLFPEMDNTRPEGGWANVFSWLAKYPAATRVQRFFAGGLFGGGLASEKLDAIIIQLDTDVLGDSSFDIYVADKFGITLSTATSPQQRSGQIDLVLAAAAEFSSLSNSDKSRHVLLPAVESTEAWCVSAFSAQPTASNQLAGGALATAFMRALESSESKTPQDLYVNIDKSARRRDRYCIRHRSQYSRIVRDCATFKRALDELAALN